MHIILYHHSKFISTCFALVIVYMSSGGELLLIAYILNVGDDHLMNEW